MSQLDLFGGVARRVAPEFFNTTHLAEPVLGAARTQARLQERAVLAIMRGAPREADGTPAPMSPSAVWQRGRDTLGDEWLLTSVRRAMSNLTAAGKLLKLEQYVEGPYGRPEHVWMVAP